MRLSLPIALVGLLIGVSPGVADTKPSAPHNIVFFLSDALRAASLPLYGYPRSNAPRLAELAKESIVFDHHIAHSPGTPISVSQMFTGLYSPPLLIGYRYLAVPVHQIPDTMPLLTRDLRQLGYRTGIVSSHYWLENSDRLLDDFSTRSIIADPDGDKAYAEFDKLIPAVFEFLDRHASDPTPFFLYIHSMDTHGPNTFHDGFDAFRDAADWPEAYNRYDSEIAFTDHWIGRIVDELRRRGLLDDTVVVVTSDHGEEFGELGPEPWNRNHGLQVRRPLSHVPLLIRLPAGEQGGTRFAGMTGHIDIAPTLMGLATGTKRKNAVRTDGRDLSERLRAGGEDEAAARTMFASSIRYWAAFQDDAEIHYDLWTRKFSPILEVSPDTHNYPQLRPATNQDKAAAFAKQLENARHRSNAQMAELAPLASEDAPDRMHVSIMLPIAEESPSRPIFETVADDDLWSLPGLQLRAAPGETPKPIVLQTPFIPGKYKVAIVFNPRGAKDYAQTFDIKLGSANASAIHVDGGDRRRVDLGTHDLGNPLRVEIANPRGGVAIGGLELERLSPDREAPAAPIDPETKERLRRLGYE